MVLLIRWATLIENRDALIEDGIIIQQTLTNCEEIDSQIDSTIEEQEVVTELIRKCNAQNAADALDQEDYARLYTIIAVRWMLIKILSAVINGQRSHKVIVPDGCYLDINIICKIDWKIKIMPSFSI